MSLFQCDSCGCLENTSCTNAYWRTNILEKKASEEVKASYKEIMGLGENEPFGNYCSACTPIWYDSGDYGIGKNPDPKPGSGKWHGRFERLFLPKEEFETAPNGNLRHKKTLDEDVRKFALEVEEA